MRAASLFALLSIVCACAEGATINAANCSQSTVQQAINSASTGDTVSVPAGSCTWSTLVTIAGKNITLAGAGVDQTTITSSTLNTNVIRIGTGSDSGNSSRITGFTLKGGYVVTDGDGWRVDHMKIDSNQLGTLGEGVWAWGLRPGVPYGPTGLVDNNTFIDTRVLVFGFPDVAEHEGSLWVSPLGLGDPHAVYIEDNTFTLHLQPDSLDCNYGGRLVYRHNVWTNSSIDLHSNQGWRGCRRWEVYNSTGQLTSGGYFTPVFFRGGTGVIFNNTITGAWTETGISFDNVRSFDNRAPLGQCNGSSFADGNQLPNGWPCRDQIGHATDTFAWTVAGTAPPQISEPAYLWGNTWNGSSPVAINIRNGSSAWIVANRDYYNHAIPFNGTSGVGVGTLASRPATCTAGVAYWATDQGKWNSTTTGPDGQLYKCTATNTWSLYYIPYTYPHPLRSSSSLPPPTNLRVM